MGCVLSFIFWDRQPCSVKPCPHQLLIHHYHHRYRALNIADQKCIPSCLILAQKNEGELIPLPLPTYLFTFTSVTSPRQLALLVQPIHNLHLSFDISLLRSLNFGRVLYQATVNSSTDTMESPTRPRNRLSLALRSTNVRDLSKNLLKAASESAERLDPDPPPGRPLEIPKPSRRATLRRALWDGFGRNREAKKPVPQAANEPPETESIHPDVFPERRMSLIGQQASRNNGGPVRQQQPVIDLTSDDSSTDEDDYFEELPDRRVKKERLDDAGIRPAHEPIARMEDRNQGFGLQEPLRPPAVPQYARPRDIWGDYDLDEEYEDADLAEQFDFDQEIPFQHRPANRPRPAAPGPVPHPLQEDIPEGIMESRIECVDTIVNVFPDICRDHVSELYDTVFKSSQRLIAHILDNMDKGSSYPNAKEKQKDLKRKREVDIDAEAARKYGAPDRVMSTAVGGIRSYM